MKEIEYLEKYYEGNIEEAKKRLKHGEPVQYIVGNVDFYGYIFKVNKNVLIPRFETEELVNRTIKIINQRKKENAIEILDIGTGSGCIAITLKKELQNSNITAVDISEKALEIAKENAKFNNVDIEFIKSDVYQNINKRFDVIISNPPYIKIDEEIEDKVKNNEPALALYAGKTGLDIYIKILDDIKDYIKEEFLIAFEIGETQGEEIKEYAKKILPNSNITIEKDMYERNRYIFITNIE